MKARWISEDPSPNLPVVGRAMVAGFWPWKYYMVTTFKEDYDSPAAILDARLRKIANEELNVPCYITWISPCRRDFTMKDGTLPIFEAKHSTLEEAKFGHSLILSLFKTGKLKFNK
jgi:hypothetical protein